MNSSCGAKTLMAIIFWFRSKAWDSDADCCRAVLTDLATRELNAFLWVFLIAVTALLLARVVKLFRLWAKAVSIPGPPCPSFYGHHKLLSRGNFTEVLAELHKKHGPVVKLWLSPTKLLVSIKDPTLIKQTLLKFSSLGAAENLVNSGESSIGQKFVIEGVTTLFAPLLERYEVNARKASPVNIFPPGFLIRESWFCSSANRRGVHE